MENTKQLSVYKLLLVEGTAEAVIFAYITKNRYRELFSKSTIKFSDGVEIIRDGNQIVSRGNLYGIGDLGVFESKLVMIKDKYPDQKLFFLLDKDLDDSLDIARVIEEGGDMIQFMEHNSEHLLLKFAGKKPKNPDAFNTMKEFRDYTKSEFKKHFKKEAHQMKERDLEPIFDLVSDEDIRSSFSKLFQLCTKEDT